MNIGQSLNSLIPLANQLPIISKELIPSVSNWEDIDASEFGWEDISPMTIEGGRQKLPPYPIIPPVSTTEIFPQEEPASTTITEPVEPYDFKLPGFTPPTMPPNKIVDPIDTEIQDIVSQPYGHTISKEGGSTAKGGEIAPLAETNSQEIIFSAEKGTDIPSEWKDDLGSVLSERLFNDTNHIANKDLVDYINGKVRVFDADPNEVKKLFGERRGTSKVAVKKYAEEMRQGAEFPPVYIYEGKFVDGGNRVEAAILAKKPIKVMDITDIVNDAIEFGKGEGWTISKKKIAETPKLSPKEGDKSIE